MDVLRRRSIEIIAHRARSTYHTSRRTLIPRFIRKYFYQHPRAPLSIAFGILTLVFFSPYIHFMHARWILEPIDYVDYRKHYNHVVLMRARYGDDWYIPFLTPDVARMSFEFYRSKTAARRAGLKLPTDNPSTLTEADFEKLPKTSTWNYIREQFGYERIKEPTE